MAIDKRKLTIQILALIGLGLSVKLAMIYYAANYNKYALASFCSINDFVDCDGAARTTFSQFLGIPLAYWGMLFYLTTLFLTFVDKLKKIKFLRFLEVFKNPMSYIAVIGTFAFLTSITLAGISIWIIKKLCILCVITYFIDFLIALIAIKGWKEYFLSYKTTVIDFIDGAKKYPKTFIILLISAITLLTVSEVTDCFLPHVRKTKEIRRYAKMTENPYKTNGNILGAEKADEVIDLYSDFGCPMCYVHNIMLHRAVKEYSNIQVIHHNLPFDTECNREIAMTMHPGACYMARAALSARKQGNYWGMSSLLYENHPRTDAALTLLVEKLNMDKDKFFKDLNSKEIDDELQKEIYHTYELNLDSTPTTFINGEKTIGIMSYEDLQKLLEKHGAKKRK